MQTCVPDGVWGPCEGQVLPGPKDCSTPNVDEACNGTPGPCDNPPVFALVLGDGDQQTGYAVAADPSGNVLWSGTNKGTIDFGAGPQTDGLFLVKLDPGGALLWQRTFATGGYSRSVSTDAAGNVTLFGAFSDTLDLGSGPLTAGSDGALFIARFAGADGGLLWAQAFALNIHDRWDWSAATSPAGEVAITGRLRDAADFGGGTLSSAGQDDVFVAHYDAGGNHLWSKRFGDGENQLGTSVAFAPGGEIVVGGHFTSTIDLGGGALTAEGSDIFIVVLNTDGSHVRSQALGGAGYQSLNGLAVDAQGDISLVGVATSSVDLGGGPAQAPGADRLCFVGRLSSTGAHQWTVPFGCHRNELVPLGPRVATRPAGGVVVTGGFEGTTDFGQGPVSDDSTDAFAFALDGAGGSLWAVTFASTGYDLGLDVTVDANGYALLTGLVGADVDLGAGLVPAAGWDAYLVRIAP